MNPELAKKELDAIHADLMNLRRDLVNAYQISEEVQMYFLIMAARLEILKDSL